MNKCLTEFDKQIYRIINYISKTEVDEYYLIKLIWLWVDGKISQAQLFKSLHYNIASKESIVNYYADFKKVEEFYGAVGNLSDFLRYFNCLSDIQKEQLKLELI